ncbi:MAG: tRNA glutamyl-Q(34) synthetase GluQRS, partial [Thioalkalispiraceae bacterium]
TQTDSPPQPAYRGRFAPSPTGQLHFGSLIAAVASYCQARTAQGEWLLRIEDIDTPREVTGACDDIIRTLENFGFQWDGAISYQHQHSEDYNEALNKLRQDGMLYPCACSRREIAKINKLGIYPGTCRDGLPEGRHARSWRIRTEPSLLSFTDAIQGNQQFDIQQEIGDFVLKRADGLFAYQLAVAIDDARQGITQVVRGYDLLDSTPRQIYVQQQLGLQSPEYAHHPIAVDAQGEKLSKRKLSPQLKQSDLGQQLAQALDFLGHPPPAELSNAGPESLWNWAFANWSLAKIPRHATLPAEDFKTLSDT